MRAQEQVELVAGGGEGRLVLRAVDRVGQKQAAEEHDLGGQKEPHAQFVGFVLLLQIVELVRQRGRRAGGMDVSHD